jgi:hypothetical protein
MGTVKVVPWGENQGDFVLIDEADFNEDHILYQEGGDDDDVVTGEQIAEALELLDPTDDNHWTAAGLPSMDAVADALGVGGFSRADVEAANPGFKRPAPAE